MNWELSEAGELSGKWLFVGFALLATSCGWFDSEPTLADVQRWKETGEHGKAFVTLKRILQANPDSGKARKLLAEVYIAAGQGELAEKQLQRVDERDADHLKLMAESRLLQGDGEWVLAEIQPGRFGLAADEARILRGRAYLQRGAIAYSETEFKYAEHAIGGQIGLVRVALQRMEYDEAERILRKIGVADASNPEAALLWGMLHFQKRRYLQAKSAFRSAGAGFGGGVTRAGEEALLWVARVELQTGNPDAAAEIVDGLLATGRAHPRVRFARAAIAFETGDYTTAERHLMKVLKRSPSHPPSLLLMGTVQFYDGNREQAALYLRRLLSEHPDNRKARKLLAIVEMNLNRHEETKSILAPLLRETESDPVILAMYGEALVRTGEIEMGVGFYRKAVSAAPDNTALLLGLARAQLMAGNARQARIMLDGLRDKGVLEQHASLLRVIAALHDQDIPGAKREVETLLVTGKNIPEIHNAAGVVFARAGDIDLAREQFEMALKLNPEYHPAAINIVRLKRSRGTGNADPINSGDLATNRAE